MMRVQQKIEFLKDDLVKAVRECIRIESVKGVAEPGAPFGPGISRALTWTLGLGESLGFKIKNVDGYAGHIELGSAGETIGILGHLDVVPAGEGWTFPPFGGNLHEGRIYGRGALDDKGPTLAALFAMKAIMDSGYNLKKNVRLILGTNEESGEWEDLKRYEEQVGLPPTGFAPDAEFPLIHAEKGILHLELRKTLPQLRYIQEIRGGERPNIVPGTCKIVLKEISLSDIQAALKHYHFPEGVTAEVKEAGKEIHIIVRGISAHGSLPEKGKNAVAHALQFLNSLSFDPAEQELLGWLCEHLAWSYAGEGLGLASQDEVSGKLSLNLGLFELLHNHLSLVLDIRYPVTRKGEEFIERVQAKLEGSGFSLKVLSHQNAHHVPKDSPLVQSLLKAYGEVTGFEPYAFAIGGGTYAKALKEGVAFGPVFPGEPDLIHRADEYITVDHLMLTAQIYAEGILNLGL